MSNKGTVFVDFNYGERAINVKCVINFETPVTNFCFSLSTLLTVKCISTKTDSQWKLVKEWQPQWKHSSNAIEVISKTPMKELIIEYSGCVLGWCNIIEERRIALSAYSAWTIFETSSPITFVFKIMNMEDYFVIKSQYEPLNKLYIYGETDHDEGNIIALKKGEFQVINKGNFNFYFLNKAEKVYAEQFAYYFNEIVGYYLSIFGKKEIHNLDIVSLDMEKVTGAYFRKELIVINKIPVYDNINKIREYTISILGHELGHNWFFSADTTTWEDWVGETGAEWANLLYILSLGDIDFFERSLSSAKEKYKDTPVIKSSDLKRPSEGVHIRGVMMFYEIYCKYGTEMIIKILQALSEVKVVTTDNFLKQVKARLGENIATTIERGLTMKDYGQLFL